MVQSVDVAGERNVVDAETSLTGLIPFTDYSIQVAAVNEEGDVGLYSHPLTRQTEEDSEFVIKPIQSRAFILSHCSSWSCDHHTIFLFLQNKHHLEPTREA